MVPEVDPDEPVHYEPVLWCGNGPARRLQQDSRWMVRVNPLMPGVAYVYSAREEFVGCVPRWERVCRADTESLKRAFGRAAHAEAELVAPAKALGATIVKREIEKRVNNAAVLGGRAGEQESLAEIARAAIAAEAR
jgi:hypothetical protein